VQAIHSVLTAASAESKAIRALEYLQRIATGLHFRDQQGLNDDHQSPKSPETGANAGSWV
jgi:hypothetical protein